MHISRIAKERDTKFKPDKMSGGHGLISFLVITWSLAVGFWLLFAQSSLAETVYLTQIEQTKDRGYDYLDVYTTGWTEAKGLLLENKLYLDFPNTKLDPKLKILRRKSKRIKEIKAEQKDQSTARLIITLNREIDYDIVNVFGRNKSVIEIGDRLENIYAYQFAWEKQEVKKKAPPLRPYKLEPLVSEKPLLLKGQVIILDPGHGGDDPGAFTLDGIPEKTLTLQTAQKVAPLLRSLGATVYLTRNEDRRNNLKEIAAFAQEVKADLLISLHYNATDNPQISGTETYYYNPCSQKFAEVMHETLIRGIKRKDRGLRRVPFYVVKNTEAPSVLLEPVYLTHPEESSLIKSSSFQEEIARDIVQGIKTYVRSKHRY